MLCVITLSLQADAQKINADKVPSAVISAFKAKFPKATKAKWEMENKKVYEANFEVNEKEVSALFDFSESWLETETEIQAAALPQTAKETISHQFKEYKTKEAERVEKKGKPDCFEGEIVKGKEILEIAFSTDGVLLEKKSMGKKNQGDND